MDNFYIYKFNYSQKDKNTSATVIFCDRNEIEEKYFSEAIKNFHEYNSQSDEIYVIAGNYIDDNKLKNIFINKAKDTFEHIPALELESLLKKIYLINFDQNRNIKCINNKNIPEEFEKKYLNEGLQNIFKARGGLVVSEGGHHFVFPSGRHSEKFLRVANILLNSCEIYFIAFNLLKFFNDDYKQIYCDTSSINTIAFTLLELRNRFLTEKIHIPIKSFGSYEGLFKNDIQYEKSDLLLISASTSGSIIDYISKRQSSISRDNIIIMFFLGKDDDFRKIGDRLLCNLTQSENNPNGILLYNTYKDNCEHCKNGSYPVEIKGDVFSLEKPKINKITLKITDAEKNLSEFVRQFITSENTNTIFKSNFHAESENQYEIFIDYNEILKNIENKKYLKYKNKLNSYIDQYVPSSTRYIISLDDPGSKSLEEYILNRIKDNYINKPTKIESMELINDDTIDKSKEGSILIISSCISNEKNLLRISRLLRTYDNLKIVYFTGITRTKDKNQLNTLKSNLQQGNYGTETNSFIVVENIYCTAHTKNSPWTQENEFIDEFFSFMSNNLIDSEETRKLLEKRKEITGNKLITENLFYPVIKDNEQLKIRKNFAFFKFKDYEKYAKQSDIYFTISNVINSLRDPEKNDRNLIQSTFVRNIIEPSNFNRFNDGIIQASTLRAAVSDELYYSINYDLSSEMANILEVMIKYSSDEQGEALLEFLYAIAIKKLSLKPEHLKRVLNTINTKENIHEIIKCFGKYINHTLLEQNNA